MLKRSLNISPRKQRKKFENTVNAGCTKGYFKPSPRSLSAVAAKYTNAKKGIVKTMRIITGSAKGAKIETLDTNATRPTAEKVKEAIFSMLQFDLEGRQVLDLFGGSGQLGLEALSRGAAKATIIDESRDAVKLIIENAKHTKLFDRCRISATSAEAFIKSFKDEERFNIVLLDPPYDSTLMHDSLKLLCDSKVCAPGALIVCESETKPSKKKNKEKKDPEKLAESVLADVFAGDSTLAEQYNLERSTVYGRTRVTLLTLKD